MTPLLGVSRRGRRSWGVVGAPHRAPGWPAGGYRIEEDEADHPPGRGGGRPGPRERRLLAALRRRGRSATWVGWAALPAYLLFAWLTGGLIWIDLDVHRLPVGLVVPTGGLAGRPARCVASTRHRATGAGWGRSSGRSPWAAVYLLLGGAARRAAWAVVTCGSRRSSGALLGSARGRDARSSGLLAGFLVGGLAAVALLAAAAGGPAQRRSRYGPAMCLGAWVAHRLG